MSLGADDLSRYTSIDTGILHFGNRPIVTIILRAGYLPLLFVVTILRSRRSSFYRAFQFSFSRIARFLE